MGIGGFLATLLAVVVAAAVLVAGYYVYATWRIARRAERLVPPPGKFIEVDGHRIHYVERGQGRPLLFVHGLGGTQFHFRPLFPELEKEFRLIAVDRPGSGYSTRNGLAPASPKEHAAFLARLIDRLGLERPLVVGHSLGGAVSLALALDHAEKIAGLALLSPLTQREGKVAPEFAALYIPSPFKRRLIAHTVAIPGSVKMAQQTLAFIFGPQQPPADYAVAGGALLGLRPAHFFGTSTDFGAIGRTMKEQQARYGELSVPVGILFGTADRVVDFERHGKALEGVIPDLDLEMLEGVGHMPQYAATERVAAFIRRMADKAFGKS